MADLPLILLDPQARPIDLIFSEKDKHRLEALGRVLWHKGAPASDEHIDAHLPQAVALIGETPMPTERLKAAPKLKMIAEVSGVFQPNIDYEECHRRNIPVLSCAPAFSSGVAEMALGLALASMRGIAQSDAAFRAGQEIYSGASNRESFLLRGRTLGLFGCGNIGRSLLPLLKPFGGEILVHDPWLHDRLLEQMGVQPVDLDTLLGRSQVLFILASVTPENRQALGAEQFGRLQPGSLVVLVSRAAVVNFDALLDAAESGHIRAAIDVFPQEPVPLDARVRQTPNVILSAHRAGGIPESYRQIGQMVVDDLELILRGLPPQRMQRASLEIVRRLQS